MPALVGDAVKVTLRFNRLGGEIAETGFWFGLDSVGGTYSQAALQSFADAVWGLFVTRWTTGGLNAFATSQTKPVSLKATLYLAGDVASDLVAIAASEVAAGISTTAHPYQCSMVVSLRSLVPTKSGRGRMYMPFDGVIMGVSGQYHPNAAAVCVAEMDTFLTAVNGLSLGGVAGDVIVASHTTGQGHRVTTLVVNTIPDIQRRRANRETANATSTATL